MDLRLPCVTGLVGLLALVGCPNEDPPPKTTAVAVADGGPEGEKPPVDPEGKDGEKPPIDPGGKGGEKPPKPPEGTPGSCPGQPYPRRYISLFPDPGDCVTVGDWEASPLFRAPGLEPTEEEVQVAELEGLKPPPSPWPAPLQRFCQYTWQGETEPAGPPAVKSTAIDPDCDRLLPQAPAPSSLADARKEVRRRQAARTRRELGIDDRRGPSTNVANGPYVAIIDTADTTSPGDPTPPYFSATPDHAAQRHGLMMQGLIDAVRCSDDPSDTCRNRRFTVQAFTRGAVPGQIGSLGSLAQALGVAMVQWQAMPDAADSGLVINMSVGWDLVASEALDANHMDLLQNNPSAVPVPARAVHAALAWAACSGGLSFASSGNDRGIACEQTGAMGPAAWEQWPAPTAASCAPHFGPMPASIASGGGARLVAAVGGVQADDQPIAITRRDSLPERVMFAHEAVLPVEGGAFSDAWTGTSVPTAVMSGLASALPTTGTVPTPAARLERIDGSGTPIGRQAALIAGSQATPVKRIDVRRASGLLRGPGRRLTARPQSVEEAVKALVADHFTPPPTALSIERPSSEGPVCDSATVTAFGTGPARREPKATVLIAATRPQPHIPICPDCTIVRATGSTRYELNVSIPPEYATTTLDRPTLSFGDTNANNFRVVELDSPIDPQARQVISLNRLQLAGGGSLADWLENNPAITKGRFSLLVDDNRGNPPQVVNAEIVVTRN